MRAVNLIPPERRGLRRGPSLGGPLPQSRLLIASIVAVVVALGGVVVATHLASSTVSARQQTLSDLDAQIAKLPKPKPLHTSAPSRQSVVTTVANQRTTWDGFLAAVSRVLPEDVWLSTLSASTQSGAAGASAAPTASALGFTISGYTYSQPSVARLMRRLRLVPWLSGVSLSTSSKSNINNVRIYRFQVGANVISLPEVGS